MVFWPMRWDWGECLCLLLHLIDCLFSCYILIVVVVIHIMRCSIE